MCKMYMLYKKNKNKYILIIITQFDKYLHHFTYLVILISFDVLSQDGYCSYYLKVGFLNINVPVFVII